MDYGIKGGVADDIMRDVDLKTFMLGNRWCECVEDVRKGWEGAGAELAACVEARTVSHYD